MVVVAVIVGVRIMGVSGMRIRTVRVVVMFDLVAARIAGRPLAAHRFGPRRRPHR